MSVRITIHVFEAWICSRELSLLSNGNTGNKNCILCTVAGIKAHNLASNLPT